MTVTPASDGRSTMYALGDWFAAVNNGQPYVDGFGNWWRVTREEGWQGPVRMRTTVGQIAGLDGQWSGNQLRQAREVILGGTVRSATQLALQAAMDRISGLLAGDARSDTLVVAEAHVTRQAVVRRVEDQDDPVAKQSPFQATWLLQLVADDPIRYGVQLNSAAASLVDQSMGTGDKQYPYSYPYTFGGSGVGAGQMVVTNDGEITTWPTITLTGPSSGSASNLRLDDQASGLFLGITSLAAGQFVVLDTRLHQVLLQGVEDRRDLLMAGSDWFGIPAGSHAVVFGAGNFSDASVSMTWRDAY